MRRNQSGGVLSQEATHDRVQVAFVDQGDTSKEPAQTAARHGVELCVVKLPTAERAVRVAAQRLGGRAQLRVGGALPALGV